MAAWPSIKKGGFSIAGPEEKEERKKEERRGKEERKKQKEKEGRRGEGKKKEKKRRKEKIAIKINRTVLLHKSNFGKK